MAGGSFSAGFMGTAVGVSSTGFIAGAATGAATGFSGGFVTGAGNAWLGGSNFGEGLLSGVKTGGIGALTGGVTGGVVGGIDALTKGANFWTGNATLDLSNAYGASGTAIGDKTITGKYVGKFEGANVYESKMLGEGVNSGGLTLPERGIIVGKGTFAKLGSSSQVKALMQHEFGHILQVREIGPNGLKAYYRIIAPESLASATMDGIGGWNHNTFWTETWANYLSHGYFGTKSLLNNYMWPTKDISWYNSLRLFFAANLP